MGVEGHAARCQLDTVKAKRALLAGGSRARARSRRCSWAAVDCICISELWLSKENCVCRLSVTGVLGASFFFYS